MNNHGNTGAFLLIEKDLFKKHCVLTEFVRFSNGEPSSFYTQPNCGTVYAYKLHQFPELLKLKRKEDESFKKYASGLGEARISMPNKTDITGENAYNFVNSFLNKDQIIFYPTEEILKDTGLFASEGHYLFKTTEQIYPEFEYELSIVFISFGKYDLFQLSITENNHIFFYF